jgi:hypothetical protein
MSHLTCFRDAVAKGYKRILILEDDAQFPWWKRARLRQRLNKLHEVSWSIWYGGHNPDTSSEDGISGAHCVGFQGDAIHSVRDLLELILTREPGHPVAGPMHVDGAYTTWHRLNPDKGVAVSMPPLCVQRSSRSDIAVGNRWNNVPGIAALRRARNLFT